ncbi:MAG TPA: ABC transporter permease [Pseudoxanthomonas sp.]|nr:ABC transporter permease [Pseudoxanthomonas sp.]
MEIRPILSTLLRHKTAAGLIVLEIALSCAIICNALFVVGSRVEQMQRVSGIAEEELVYISVSSLLPDQNRDAMRRDDVATLAAVPGVVSVASVNQIPYGRNVWASSINLEPGQPDETTTATNYMDDGNMIATYGLRIIQGRGFEADEYQDMSAVEASTTPTNVPAVILGRSLAEHLFPGEDAVGKSIYIYGTNPTRVVGVIDNLRAPSNEAMFGDGYQSMILPLRTSNGDYALRVDPQRRDEVLDAAVAALNRADPNRLVNARDTLVNMRHEFHSRDRAVVWLLVSVSVALLAVTAFGIVGLASFWVAQRTRQIGIRRALGATRGDILRYFLTENFLLASFGIVLGMLLAYAINQMLMTHYELGRLPLYYLPVGAVALWLLGQLAVLGPARRAANVPPAIATRSA